MTFYVQLDDYEEVKAEAKNIYSRSADKSMPPDDPWQDYEAGQDSVMVEALLDPLVRLGESITVEGVTIELIESGESDRVRISK